MGVDGDNPSEMRTGTGDFYVDIDHIHLGLTNSISKGEPSIADAEVQTTHLVPYRLRLWPKTDCDFKLSPAETSCSLRCKCCLQVFSQWLLSQAGLTLILFIWALLGAFAFYNTEGPREQKQSQTLATIQRDLSRALATELNQTENHLASWSSTIHKYFEKHELLFLEAVGAGYGEGGGGNIWTYPGCILFSVSLLTTLGFGAPVPRTPLGRGAAVLFALVGIPLHFLLVLNVGNLTAIKIQKLAFKTDIPNVTEQPRWLNWFPFIAILVYYILGVVLFGFVRERDPVHAFMFPLDFTASGGVANVPGAIRIFYALYLEVAVTLAALVVSLIQASAGTGIVDVGLRWGLLTNT
ncbi:potassium channel subfamily K member 6-like isoform X2 [Euwallacea similis]|uniref:potassium channel subfamily K member 6-like isoform X2 n=1 Tax=Euwallacea similis TaxID=1736056 RepID=UPI00344D19D5